MRVVTAGVLLAALASAGCYTMKPVALEGLGSVPSGRVWVTRADQSTVIVDGPRVLENKLVGFVDKVYQEMPTADVTQVMARRLVPARTTALVGAGLVGIVATIALIQGSGQAPDPCIGYTIDCPFPR